MSPFGIDGEIFFNPGPKSSVVIVVIVAAANIEQLALGEGINDEEQQKHPIVGERSSSNKLFNLKPSKKHSKVSFPSFAGMSRNAESSRLGFFGGGKNS